MKIEIKNDQAHWMLAANLAPPLAMWVVAVQIARSYGPEPLGLFAITNAIVTPLVLVMQLPLRTFHVTAADASDDLRHLLGLRAVMLVIALTMIALVGSWFVSGESGFLILLGLALFRACDSYCDLIHASLQRQDRIQQIGALVLARSLLVVAVVMLLAQSGFSLSFVVSAMAIASLATSALLDTSVGARTSKIWPVRLDPQLWLAYARRLVPLSALQGVNAISGNAPRYVIQWFGGSHLLGVYSVLEHLALVTSTLVNALGQSMTARMARMWNAGDIESFRASTTAMLALSLLSSAAIASACTVFGASILHWLYGAEFAGAQPHIIEASLITIASAAVSAYGYALTASGAFRQQVGVVLLTLLITTLVATVALPVIGLSGVFLAIGLAAVVQTAISSVQLTRRLRAYPYNV